MRLRSFIFWLTFSFFVLLLGVVGLITLLAFLPQTKRWYLRQCSSLTLILAELICGVKLVVKGQQNIPKGPCIFASKHQSAWETAFFPAYIPGIVVALKKELLYFPFFGLYLYLYGMIYIDRSAGPAALRKMLNAIKARVAAGRSIYIFPEGTRVPPGKRAEIKAGIAAIHKVLPTVPIVPVYLDSGKIWPPKSLLIKSGTITVAFKKPIIGENSKEELLQKLEKEINSLT